MSPSLLPRSCALAVVGAAGLCAACGGDAPITIVEVAARPAVADVTQLVVTLANDSSMQTETFAVAGRSFPLTFSVETPGRTGELALEIAARDGSGLTVGRGAAAIPIVDGQSELSVMLEPDDFVVNTTYAGSQDLAFRLDGGGRQLSVATDGRFTIGWSDTCVTVGRCDVFGRRFDATGQPIDTAIAAGDGQFNLNQTDGDVGYEPSLAVDRSGNTVATWSTGADLFAVVIDPAGAHVTGTETVVATLTSPGTPGVTALPDGRYVVVWIENAPTAGQYLVKGRFLGANGQPINNPITATNLAFTISTAVLVTDQAPAVVALGDAAAFAVAWRRADTIVGRFFGAAGTPLGPEVTLASHPTEALGPPQLALLGRDVVMTYRRVTAGGDADDGQLLVRRYTPAGAGIGAAVVVADDVEAGPAALAITGDDVGLAWAACAADSDGDGCGIRFRAYDGNLTPRGDAIPVNSTIAGDQEDPSLGWLPDRSVAVTFSDASASAPDRDGSAVRARVIYPLAP